MLSYWQYAVFVSIKELKSRFINCIDSHIKTVLFSTGLLWEESKRQFMMKWILGMCDYACSTCHIIKAQELMIFGFFDKL